MLRFQHKLLLGMSLVRLPFCIGTAVPSESSQKFLDLKNLGPQETIRKKQLKASTYTVGSMSSRDASKKRVQSDNSTMHTIQVEKIRP